MSVEWLNPVALLGIAAAVGPIAVHLLRRRRASRLPFPSLRFLTPDRSAAMRIISPGDPWLLALRIGIVAAAAAAFAQPVFDTSARRASGDRSMARAIVVDASRGMSRFTAQVRDASAAERGDAAFAVEIRTEDLRQGLRTAVTRLAAGSPARREIVVVSSMRHGALSADDVASIPADIGVRFVRVGEPDVAPAGPGTGSNAREPTKGEAAARDVQRTFGTPGVAGSVQSVTVSGPWTAVTLKRGAEGAGALRMIAPAGGQQAVQALLRSVAAAGAPAPPTGRPVALAFAPGPLPATAAPPREPWMLRAIVRMRLDPVLRDAAAASTVASPIEDRAWIAVARDARGAAVVAAAAIDGELVGRIGLGPETLGAAAAARALLFAVTDPPSWIEHEVERIPEATLHAWSRPAAPVPDARSTSAPGDARWCWAVVLLLLGLEGALRKGRPAHAVPEESARAA